jgi:predicted protein tyrosine phosphatase
MDCSYILSNLILGSKRVPLEYLLKEGVSSSICVAPENEVPTMEGINFYRFPISLQDLDAISRNNMICAKNKCIELLNSGEKVYIHCVAGFNRSPAVTAMVLSELSNISIDEAVDFINYFRIIAPEKHLALLKQ